MEREPGVGLRLPPPVLLTRYGSDIRYRLLPVQQVQLMASGQNLSVFSVPPPEKNQHLDPERVHQIPSRGAPVFILLVLLLMNHETLEAPGQPAPVRFKVQSDKIYCRT